jgi:hypothetical protein
LLTEIIDSLGITDDVDYKYFDVLDVEYIEDYDMHVLYIPDEWKHNADDVYKDAVKKLKEHNIDKADMIVMHGAFKYQIPGIESESFHDENLYVNLANWTVNCGHVHDRSQYENILVPGSFDRLTFADEGQIKGGLLVTLYPDKTFDYKILENTNALEFKTIEVGDDWVRVEKELNKLNKKNKTIHVRLISDNIDIKNILFDLRLKYPNLKFSVSKTKRDKNKHVELTVKVNKEVKELDKEIIKNYVMEKGVADGLDLNILQDELSNLLH